MANTKSFGITKEMVYRAYKAVKANRGGAGIDNVSMQEFEENLADNLYKLWNRMASGCYFPPPVMGVKIPKSTGGTRMLGIPTIADRIAQMVVKNSLEPKIDPIFSENSYGYRPGRGAHKAVEVTRTRCWKYNWVLEFDIRGLFDNIDHALLLRAVTKHTDTKWEILYIKRWLIAPMEDREGNRIPRTKGVPQGGVVSPLLANLFMHYAFDRWMEREFPRNEFCRYADDAVIHCYSKDQAEEILGRLGERLKQCGLELHPEKTKVVYCRDSNRKGNHENVSFTFLGYTFMPRKVKGRQGVEFTSFLPAISQKAQKRIRQEVRRWPLLKTPNVTLEDIADRYNPVIRGWLSYYGKYGKAVLADVLESINAHLQRWIQKKYLRFKHKPKKARAYLAKVAVHNRELFAHWSVGIMPTAG